MVQKVMDATKDDDLDIDLDGLEVEFVKEKKEHEE
jgi:hypothetical protein